MAEWSQIFSRSKPAWWKECIVYQIYPSSFMDTNGDGIGDLKGITSKVDYLHALGVDVVWLCPIYPSPNADQGYDISDYQGIHPNYGTMEDWDELLDRLHSKGMKLIMDLVVNHSSDEHEWFQQSRSSRDNEKRDWYIWRPSKPGPEGSRLPPNNWQTTWGEPAWTFDEGSGEWYLHLYTSKQPDFDWTNATVRDVVFRDIMEFWLKKGIDGFRMDVINLISKEDGLPDAPITDPHSYYQPAFPLFVNGPHVHEYLQEMNAKVLSSTQFQSHEYDIMTVGETPFTHSVEATSKYVEPARKELNMCFNFEINDVDAANSESQGGRMSWRPWKVSELAASLQKWYQITKNDGWQPIFLENHDMARSVSRLTDDTEEHRVVCSKLIASMMATLAGTLYLYQGLEIGMRNVPTSWPIEEYKDVATHIHYDAVKKEREEKGEPYDMSDVMELCQKKARDNARRWSSEFNAGFTTSSTPWMRVNDDYNVCNVALQEADPNSPLSFWKKLLKLRKAEKEVFVYGDFTPLNIKNEQVLAYTRTAANGKTGLVLLNFKGTPYTYTLPSGFERATLIISNVTPATKEEDFVLVGRKRQLQPWEAQIYLLTRTEGSETSRSSWDHLSESSS
ncbi:glycoside hydrolase family 13 protein [Atractiella rhizophila]|nr:glycoside hydrolase family 13 protein [Atractiella rhizophila]